VLQQQVFISGPNRTRTVKSLTSDPLLVSTSRTKCGALPLIVGTIFSASGRKQRARFAWAQMVGTLLRPILMLW